MAERAKQMTKRKHDPRFTSARLLKDGSVEVVDDTGEIFHVQMTRHRAWPILSRQARRFEMSENYEKSKELLEPQPPTEPFGRPRLVK